MLFKSQVPGMVEQSVITAKWRAEIARMEEAENRLALYSDDYEQIIRDTMALLFHKDNYKRLFYHVNGSQNILKRVVNELSMVYKSAATRTLDIESDRYEDIKAETDIDVRMKRANRLTNLLNDVIVKVGVRDGKIAYDIITPDICTVIQSTEDPTKLAALCWARTYVNTMGVSLIEYEYMDDLGWWVTLDENFKTKAVLADPLTYPYRDAAGRPVILTVPIHRQHPENAFWDQDSGRDLYNAGVMIGVKMTQFDYLFKAGCFKQIYAIGQNIDIPQDQVKDVSTIIKVNVDPQGSGQVGTLDLQSDPKAMVEALTFQLNTVINNYGISADMWTLSISEMSGRALKIKNRALLEQREEQIPTYRQAEADLFEKTRIVNNVHAAFFGWEKIPEQATLAVDFAEIEFPEDPNEELDLRAKRLKMGLISLGKFYQMDNPDIKDEQEAEKALVENLNKTKALREANPTLDEALDYIMSAAKEKTPGQPGAGQEGNV